MPKRTAPPPADDGPWMTRAELARHHDLARSTITRRVDTLTASGKLEVRTGADGGELISLAAFDRATAKTIDGIRAGAHRRRRAGEQTEKVSMVLFDQYCAVSKELAAEIALIFNTFNERSDEIVFPATQAERLAALDTVVSDIEATFMRACDRIGVTVLEVEL